MVKYLFVFFLLVSGSLFAQPSPQNPGRQIVKFPNTHDIQSDETCKITLRLSIDENGKVVGAPEVIKEQTTTTNWELINRVIAIVKEQVQYNSQPGSPVVKVVLTVRLRPGATS